MSLSNVIQSLLNMGGQPAPQQMQSPMPGINVPKPGPLAGLANIMDSVLSANPNYQRIAMGQQQLQSAKTANDNAPLQNALNNLFKQRQIEFMPTKYNIQQQRLDLDNRRYSPEQLATLQKLRQTQIDTAPQRAASADGKHAYERNNLEEGYAPSGNTWGQATGNMSGQPQQLPLNPQQIDKLRSLYGQQQGQQQAQPNQTQLGQALSSAIPGQGNQQPMPGQNNQPAMQQGQLMAQAQQRPAAPVKTDVGDFIAPQYANNPNLLQYDVMANKKAVPGQAQQQFSAARQLEGYVNDPDVRKSLLAFTKYAGVLGQGQKALDALKRDKPEQYKRAMEAQNITITNLTNLSRRFENLGVQEGTREEIRGTLDGAIKQITNDPKTALYLINAALRQMNTISSQVYGAAQPIRQVYTPHEFKPLSMDELDGKKANSQYSQEDIEHTAKTHGMTVEQVKQRLGVN